MKNANSGDEECWTAVGLGSLDVPEGDGAILLWKPVRKQWRRAPVCTLRAVDTQSNNTKPSQAALCPSCNWRQVV